MELPNQERRRVGKDYNLETMKPEMDGLGMGKDSPKGTDLFRLLLSYFLIPILASWFPNSFPQCGACYVFLSRSC